MSIANDQSALRGALTRRTLLQRGAATAGALAVPSAVLQACGGDDGGSATGTVNYMKGPFPGDDRKFIQDTSKPFLKKHPDIDLKVSFYEWTSRDAQLAAAYASGSPPDLAYMGDAIWVPFAKGGALEDLNSRVKTPAFRRTYDAIGPRFWDASSSDGKVYGVPLYSSATVHYVNTDLMREAGVTDWSSSFEALRKAAAQVKERTGQWGYASPITFADSGYGTTLPVIWAAGGQLYDEGMTTATADTSDVAKQLDIFQAMYVEDKSAVPHGLYDSQGLQGLFSAGKVAMFNYFSNLALVILGKAKFGWAFAPMPPLKTGADPATYVAVGAGFIASSSGVKDAAWEYLAFLSSTRAVDKYRTFVPDVYGCRDDLKATPASKPQKATEKYFTSTVVPFGQAVPPIPNSTSALRGVSAEFEALVSGKKSGSEAAKGVNEHLQAGLEF